MSAAGADIAGPTPAAGWDRPAPAPGVELLGRSAGTAYEEPPGLVRRRDGQVLQLTPLLYSVLATLDGERSHAAIAEDVSAATGRRVTADDVAWLIDEKLEPLGVLDGRGPTHGPKANPLLGLRLRWVVSRPAVTRAITRPFAALFHPLVVSVLLAAFVTSSAWLVANAEFAVAARQAVYEPLWLLALLGLTIASAAFHEFGHAAAAQSVGATPGAMGVGLYLLWPAFYTDVTDAYRLDRRERLRVDLGGLYFNAIFAVLGILAWAATGIDALLLILPIQVLQMLRQLLPFLRYDGYHVLADLTGVPDLFTQMGPTLASLKPSNWGRPSPSRLRRPARIAILAWTLVTVPLLLAALGGLLALTPRLLATTADALAMHAGAVRSATATGDLATAALGSVRVLTLAIAPLSIAYLTFRLTRQAVRLAWHRTDGSRAGRAAVLAVLAAALALVAWALAPDDDWQPIAADDGGAGPETTAVTTVAAAADDRLPARAAAHAAAASPATPPAARPQPVAPDRADPAVPGDREPGAGGDDVPPADGAVDGDLPAGRRPGSREAAPSSDEEPSTAEEPTGQDDAAPTPTWTWATALPESWDFSVTYPLTGRDRDNIAVAAVNTDLTGMRSFTTELVVGGNDIADQRNEAYALARCTDCGAWAAAMQVVLLPETPNVVIPRNIAVSLNEDCERCESMAVATQLVVSLTATPDDATLAQIEAVLAGLAPLGTNLEERSAWEVRQAFDDARRQVLRILVEADPTSNQTPAFQTEETIADETGVVHEESGSLEPGTEPDTPAEETTVVTDEPTTEPSPTPAPSPDPSTDPIVVPDPDLDPDPTPEPEPSPAPTPSPEPAPAPSPEPTPAPTDATATEPETTTVEEPAPTDATATAPPPSDEPSEPDGTATTTVAATEEEATAGA